MKKLVVLTMVMALFIGIPVCVFAQVDRTDASAYCKSLAATWEDFAAHFKNLGECVSYVQACSNPKDDAELCICRMKRMINPPGYEEFYGTQALGPCIKHLRELLASY